MASRDTPLRTIGKQTKKRLELATEPFFVVGRSANLLKQTTAEFGDASECLFQERRRLLRGVELTFAEQPKVAWLCRSS